MLYSRLNDSRTGFEPQRNLMARTFGLDGGGTIAADSAGDVYVAWHGKTLGAASGEAGRQVLIAKSSDDGKTFVAEQPAWKEPTGACACCGMAIFTDNRGIVRALYRSATENITVISTCSHHQIKAAVLKAASWTPGRFMPAL